MNLEEIWKWLKGKRNTFFAEAATAFILIAVLGVAGITAGRSGITKSSEVESVRTKAEANKVEEQEQENADGGSDCRRAVPNHGTKQCDYRADGFLFSVQWKSISGGKPG